MLIDKVINYFKGTILFKINDPYTEKLLNFCRVNEITLKRIKKVNAECTATCFYKDYAFLEEWAKKNNISITPVKKRGVPFKLKKYRYRWGIAVGMFLFAFCLVGSQFFVLDISVEGNSTVETKTIINELDKLGVSKFKFIPSIDFRIKKHEALLSMPKLSWLTINHQGCRLFVKVTEKEADVYIKDTEICDIVASDTGLILHMEVYNGTKVTDKNYTVEKGDVLVKGEFLNKLEEVTKVHADAKVIAQVQFEKTISLNMKDSIKDYTGKKTIRYYIDFFSLKLPLFIATPVKGEYDYYSDSFPIYCFGKKLPIGIIKIEYEYYTLLKEKVDKIECKSKIENEFLRYEALELSDCVILDRKDKETVKNGVITIKRSYTVEKNIAKKVKSE